MLSPQRPIYESYRQSPRQVGQYPAETLPEAVAQARAMGADIRFVDEAPMPTDAHRGLTWGKVGEISEGVYQAVEKGTFQRLACGTSLCRGISDLIRDSSGFAKKARPVGRAEKEGGMH